MHLLRPFLADNRGVVAIVVGLMSAILLPAAVTAYYFVQLSASKDILTTVCQRVLAAYVEAEDTATRAPAMATVVDGLVGDKVLKDVTTAVTLVSGAETFAKGDAEANRPIFELALHGTDVAAQDNDLGGKVGTKCKAKLGFSAGIKLKTVTRNVQVVAGSPPAVPASTWGTATHGLTNAAMKTYMEQTITDKTGTSTRLTTEVWSRNDGITDWLFPTATNLRMSGTFTSDPDNAAVLSKIRPTYLVNLTPKDTNKIWITSNDSSAPIGYPAIKPRCYDPEDSDDDDGFGWEPDPALLPGGSGKGQMGTLVNSSDDYDHEYIAVVGVDRTGKYAISTDNEWRNLKNWAFYYKYNNGSANGGVKSTTIPAAPPFISFTLKTTHDGSSTGYWKFETGAAKASSAGGYKAEVKGTLYKYDLTMKIDCPQPHDWRASIPVTE